LYVRASERVQVYLGRIITEDNRCQAEIKPRIAMVKSAFSKNTNFCQTLSATLKISKRG